MLHGIHKIFGHRVVRCPTNCLRKLGNPSRKFAVLTNLSVSNIHAQNDYKSRRTKIVCTLGPASWSVEGLGALIDAGMNIARFNFSHGDHQGHTEVLGRLKEAMKSREGCDVAVMLDTKGPEIRTGTVDRSVSGGKIKYNKGDKIEVGTDYSRPCTSQYLACSYKSLLSSVKVGKTILVADGSLSLKVLDINPSSSSIRCEVLNNAVIGSHKNMNLPGCVVDLPTLTDKDKDDIVNWGIRHDIDFIAASFIRSAEDVQNIKALLNENKQGGKEAKQIKIISKIENQQGLENFDSILTVTDGIMIARGDLGMEIPIEKVFIAQKMMMSKCNIAGKPVVTATQMMESMISNPRPTRAECSDIANAVIEGSDAVMLSGESANGEYPTAAVSMMSSICIEAESIIDYDNQYDYIKTKVHENNVLLSPPESIASSAVKISHDLSAKLIIVISQSGNTARYIAKYRPKTRIYAITSSRSVARQMNGILKGVDAHVVENFKDTETVVQGAISDCLKRGIVNNGETVVVVHGPPNKENTPGATSAVRVLTVVE